MAHVELAETDQFDSAVSNARRSPNLLCQSAPVTGSGSLSRIPPTAILKWLADPHASAPAHPGEWRSLLAQCHGLRLLPQAALRLTAEPEAMSAAMESELKRLRMVSFSRTASVLRGGLRALNALAAAGVPAAGFKGIAAIGWLQQGRAEREMADIDLLVAPEQADAALRALTAAGFSYKVQGVPASGLRSFSRASPGSAGNEAITLGDEAGAEIDLHWKVGRVDVSQAIAEASPLRLLKGQVPIVRPAQALLFSSLHALRNDFLPAVVLRDLLDAAGWFALLAKDPHEQGVALRLAKSAGLEPALGAMACILVDLEVSGGDWVVPSPAARSLADLFSEQSQGQNLNRDLVYLCSLRPAAQILRGLITTGPGYLATMRATETAYGQEISLRSRLKHLLRAALRTPLGQWSRLRALAAAKAQLN